MNPQNIILHHSLTADSGTVSWGAIRDYHIRVRGWRDIGYHYGIELARDHYEALIGRMWYQRGAHCRDQGMNRNSLGVCFVGNFDKEQIPVEQWNLGVQLVGSLCMLHRISVENVFGHSHFSDKSCPGKNFNMDEFKEDILELVVRESKSL